MYVIITVQLVDEKGFSEIDRGFNSYKWNEVHKCESQSLVLFLVLNVSVISFTVLLVSRSIRYISGWNTKSFSHY